VRSRIAPKVEKQMPTPLHIVAATGIITNPQGQILLIRSPKRGWEFPGGQVAEGETLIQALVRETQEEAGVTIAAGSLVGVYSNIKPPTKVIFAFMGTWISGDPTTSSESLETEWVGRDAVMSRVTHPAVCDRIQDMLEYSGRVVYRVYSTDPYQVYEKRFLTE
jgi:8-oxo-dGTP diphosphatase